VERKAHLPAGRRGIVDGPGHDDGGTTGPARTDPGTRRSDALTALGVTLVAGVVVAVTAVPVTPRLLLGGGLVTVALELVLAVGAETVQRYWRSRRVRAGSAVVFAALAVAGVVVAGGGVLVVVLGGTVTYLALLGLVALGVVPPTTAWFER
jgi:peptidoglycan/LPS O-acetylase OafA/YrhL